VGHAGLLRGLPNAASDFVDDDVVMRGIAAQQAAEANDGVVFFCLGESARGGRNFECAGNADDLDVILVGSRTNKAVVCATQKSVSNKLVEAGDDDAEFSSRRAEIAFNRFERARNFFVLFCRDCRLLF
jgi:hypothetical protein